MVLHQIVHGCYAIPPLAFRLATVITKLCGAIHSHHSAMTHQFGDSCLTSNIWLRV